MDKAIPHILGLDLVRQIEKFEKEALDSFEENFTWLDEILETAKQAFQTSQIQTLPKTPSAKRRRGKKRKSEVPSFIRRSSVFPRSVDQSLNDSYNVENVPPTTYLDTSSTYGTRGTRNLRSRQRLDSNADLSICNTSALRTRNQRNTSSRKNTFTEVPELKPTKEIRESPAEEKQYETTPPRPRVEQPKVDVREHIEIKITVTEQNSPGTNENPIQVEDSPCQSKTASPAKPEITATNNNSGESRVVNNSSFVIETLSEEESALTLPVISSPVEVLAAEKPEAMDTDSGVNSDDKEQDVQPAEASEPSGTKATSDTECDTERDTGKPSSSALSSEEASEAPRTRTRTRKQQSAVPAAAQLPVPHRESISSTTSAEFNEAPRMTRSRMRKPVATTESTLVPVPAPANPPSEKTVDEPEEDEPRTRTRTRHQKRQSCEMEGRKDSEMKRLCPEPQAAPTEKRRSVRLGAKQTEVEESPEDADTEDYDPDDEDENEADVTQDTESWMDPSTYRTPNNLGSTRSFLKTSTMNTSYMSANRTPSQKSFTLYKYIQGNSSFSGSAQKTQSRMNLLSGLGGGIKSLLKKTTTPLAGKGTPKINQQFLDQRKRELDEKRMKEQERLMKREEVLKMKLDERKKKREDRTRKVAESRQLKEIQEKELKDKKTKKLEEKLSVTDRIREDKLREERERLRLRLKKQAEAEERRNLEDEDRTKKLREQEEENMRHQSMLHRKKEYEEQERQRRLADDKRKFEDQKERMLEAEKDKQNEFERRRKIEEDREQERQKLKEEREREREREAARIRAEQRELQKEKQREAEEVQRQKLREMEQERLVYEQQLAEKKQQREQYIAKVLNQPSSVVSPAVAPLSLSSSYQKEVTKPVGQTLNTSYKVTSNPDSYQMTPMRSSYNNYDITGLKSDDSTDEEEGPRKPIPGWAGGPELKIALLKQYYNPPNLDMIFRPIELPDLNELFIKKKSRFNRRTSSAVWDTPIPLSHIPCFN